MGDSAFMIINNAATYRAQRLKDRLTSRRMFMKGAGAGAIIAGLSRLRKSSGGVFLLGGAPAGSSGAGYYPAGHWINSPLGSLSTGNQTASQIYPRPDSETNTWARHRWHYSDASNAFKNVTPIIARLGAFPYVYEIITAPAAANAQMGAAYWQPNWTIADALAAGYGDLWCSPNGGSYSGATFTIRVHDQAGNHIDVTFTASTTLSTTYFVFLDPVNGLDTNAGTIAAPIQTLSAGAGSAFGSTAGSTTYPNATLVLRSTGNIAATAQSSSNYGIAVQAGASPMAIINFPGEAPVVDVTNAGIIIALNLQPNANDGFFQGFSFTGGPSAAASFSYLGGYQQYQERFTAHNISAPNVYSGTDATDNATLIEFDDPGGATPRPYIALKGISETNRVANANNAAAITDQFMTQYVAMQFCTATGVGATQTGVSTNAASGPTLKASVLDASVVACKVVLGAYGIYAMEFYDQAATGEPASTRREVCYCILDASANTSTYTMEANGSYQNNSGVFYAYRNSHVGAADVNNATSQGPYSFQNDAIQYGSAGQPIQYDRATGPLPAEVTNTGTLSQGSTGIFDAGTYTLTNAARNGLDGANIT